MKYRNNIIYFLIGILLYITLPVERKYFINKLDEKENKKEVTLELAKEMANVKIQIEQRSSGYPTEFPYYEITVEKVFPKRNTLISIVTIILLSFLDPISFTKKYNFMGSNFRNKKGYTKEEEDLTPTPEKNLGIKEINYVNDNQNQIELYKALYNFSKEYIKEYQSYIEQEVGFIDYSISELSKLTGIDKDSLNRDRSFRSAAILAFEDATLPEGQRLVFESIYASIEAKGNNAQKVNKETIKMLEDYISKAETKIIKIGSLEMTLEEAEELLTFLNRRYCPFVVTSVTLARSTPSS
jgi:hypothetical protein